MSGFFRRYLTFNFLAQFHFSVSYTASVKWTVANSMLYYMQLAKVLNPTGASARLASNGGSEATSTWQYINQLKRFIAELHVRSAPAEHHGYVNLPIPENLVIT